MKHLLPILLISALCRPLAAQTLPADARAQAERLRDAALADATVWTRLTDFVDRFPQRLSGSPMLAEALDHIEAGLRADGFDRVWRQPVMVPHWVRGHEYVRITSPTRRELPMLGLGNSVGTDGRPLEADVMVVADFEELAARAGEARGRIVLFNTPFTNYGATVGIRVRGPIEAAKLGAAAVIIRSVTPYSMQTPHTGTTRYEDGVPRIPAAAITPEDADWIARDVARGQRVRVELMMEARMLPDALSHNVIAEIRGSELPDEIVVMGGHIDSWDVGQGAMDDAGGCFAAWEALRLMKELGIRPRRTIRLVFWTNEENGLRGGEVYKDSVAANGELERHVLAIESDAGVFRPEGFGVTADDPTFAKVQAIGTVLEPIGAGTIRRGGGGADIGPLNRAGNVPMAGLNVDGSKYFWYHHTHADTIDKLKPDEVQACVAAMAVLSYLAAETF